ncbi:recombinase family protein [Pseudomonas sp. TH31]|uniref:recombinase family protein n=1 Tax=Pseudomonas sp. TH31 TaxID=2796396 RepID=UPI00406D410B
MLIGYARVSTQDQNLDLQREALIKAGCHQVFEDKVSGTQDERPGLIRMQEILREGDTLVVCKLDRLGRSVKQLVDLVAKLHKQGVQFKSLTDSIDTGTPSGRFFFHFMACLAEMELELIDERTRAGLEAALNLGRAARPAGGAQAKNDHEQNHFSPETAGQRHSSQGRGRGFRRVQANAIPLASGFWAWGGQLN